jgi:hypothetical protein
MALRKWVVTKLNIYLQSKGKWIFLQISIHVFDLKESGRYANGFRNGNITLKIRKTDNNDLSIKLEDLSQKITKMGMNFKKSNDDKMRHR